MDNEMLEHHGILGQKWGVRRYQNPDGSLTEEGSKRYNKNIIDAKGRIKKAEKQYINIYKKSSVFNPNDIKNVNKAFSKVLWEKEKLSNEYAKAKLVDKNKTISVHQQQLIDSYIQKGMNQQEAEIAAYKRIKTERILAVTAAMTLTAATAYVAYKSYDKKVDKIIPMSKTLQNMSNSSNKGVEDAFYASLKKSDNIKYRGLYGKELAKNGKVYETKIGLNANLKLASEKSAMETLSQLVRNNPQYEQDLKLHLNLAKGRFPLESQNHLMDKALKSLENGKVDSKVYEALNLTLPAHSLSTSESVNKGFYNALKSKGYDAIMDINDKKYSGYNSKKPIIVFNASAKAFVKKSREVGTYEIGKDFIKSAGDVLIKTLAPEIAIGSTAIGIGNLRNKSVESNKRDKIVSDYRKKHPETKLSYNEILNNYFGK